MAKLTGAGHRLCTSWRRSRMGRLASFLLALSGCLALHGCGLPRSGPMQSEMNAASDRNEIALVPVTPEVALASRKPDRENFPAFFLSAQPADYERLMPGDGVNVKIWERDGLGVFPAQADGTTDLGELVLDRGGDIAVPYVGKIRAEGLTAAQLRDALVRALSGIVVSPDVTVSITGRRGQTVTIQGDLSKPGVYPISQEVQRLSGLLGLAAPNQENPEQVAITVRRQGLSGSVRLSDIYRNAADDIALHPGDSVFVHAVVETLTVLGAAGAQGRVVLKKRNYSVLDALGDSRGLSDSVANPRAVFLLRPRVREDVAEADHRPIVYQFDFTRPDQMVLAGEFMVRDGDAIYVSDAPFTQVQKLLSTFSATLSTARSVNGLPQ